MISSLLNSGNLAGLLGLALMIWVGVRLILSGHRGGWLLSIGAGLVAFSMVYRLYLEPLLERPLHLTFTQTQIVLATAAPTISLTLGFLLIPIGLLMVAARQQKELKPVPVRNR